MIGTPAKRAGSHSTSTSRCTAAGTTARTVGPIEVVVEVGSDVGSDIGSVVVGLATLSVGVGAEAVVGVPMDVGVDVVECVVGLRANVPVEVASSLAHPVATSVADRHAIRNFELQAVFTVASLR